MSQADFNQKRNVLDYKNKVKLQFFQTPVLFCEAGDDLGQWQEHTNRISEPTQ